MPKPLAEIVIEETLCTEGDVRGAAELADREKIPLVAALCRTTDIDEVALVAALKRHIRVATCDPASTSPDPEAVREISRDVCRRLRALPLAVSSYGPRERQLRVAMADPTDAVAVAELEHVSGCRIEPQLMTLSAVEELIERTYKQFVTEVMRRNPARDTVVEAAGKGGAGESKGEQAADDGPSTVPFHRVADEATVEMRIAALTRLLIGKGILDEDEYEEELRLMLKSL